MIARVFEDKHSLSKAAAEQASAAVRGAIHDRGCARIIVATGRSQLDFLDSLTNAKNIDWQRVEMFHLDEYVGLPVTHPASFRKYLLERLICDQRPWMLLLSASERTGIWRLMILRPIFKHKSRTSSSNSMKLACANR